MNSFKKIFFSFISLLVFGAVIILGVVLFPSPGFSHPVINWMPGRATETVAQGGNKTTVVSFVSRKDLTNVSVWVVPELQPYISANPSYFSSINAGDLNIITLNISAPLTPPMETESLDGAIHLKDKTGSQKTYSNPLPFTLTIEGWAPLEDTQSGITLHYPPEYQVNKTLNGQGNTFDMWESLQNLTEGLPPSFTIVVQNIDLQGEPLESFVDRTLEQPFTINGYNQYFLEVFEPSEGEGLFHHLIYNSDKMVLMDIIARTENHDSDLVFVEILNSLKF